MIELVRSGRYPRGRWFKRLSEKDHQHVQRALEAVGMWDMRNRRIGELSGGQKQRISLARILLLTLTYLFLMNQQQVWMKNPEMNFIVFSDIVRMSMGNQF